MKQHPDPELSARLQRAASTLDDAADRYEHELVKRHAGSAVAGRQLKRGVGASRPQLLGTLAAASVALIAGAAVFASRDVRPRDSQGSAVAVDVAQPGSPDGLVPLMTTVVRSLSDGVATSTTVSGAEAVVDLGSVSAPTEIVFAPDTKTITLRAWFPVPSAGTTTIEVGSPHGSGTFRAAAGQTLTVSAATPTDFTTVKVSQLDTNSADSADSVIAEFTLPGRGSVCLPASGRYSILIETNVAEPMSISLTID
jgi:hypothetical protein